MQTFGVLDQMEFSGTVRILSQCSCFSRLRCVMLACTWQILKLSAEHSLVKASHERSCHISS